MILIKPSTEIEGVYMEDPRAMERIGRVCYKSEDRITDDSAERFIKARLGKHESVIEHSALTVRFICDRGIGNELVRHRHCAFTQESTRYCNYRGGISFVIPPWVNVNVGEYSFISSEPRIERPDWTWYKNMLESERDYKDLLSFKWTPEQARSVLPLSTKTELILTTNFREWRWIFQLRDALSAHPQMRELMIPLLEKVKQVVPIIFDDLTTEEN